MQVRFLFVLMLALGKRHLTSSPNGVLYIKQCIKRTFMHKIQKICKNYNKKSKKMNKLSFLLLTNLIFGIIIAAK